MLATQVTVFNTLTGHVLAQGIHPGASTSYRIAQEMIAAFQPSYAEIRGVKVEEKTKKDNFGNLETFTVNHVGGVLAEFHSKSAPEITIS